MNQDKYVYVVLMQRWGDEDGHSYVKGVFDTLSQAESCGNKERENRDNKYEYVVLVFNKNSDKLVTKVKKI